MLWCNGFCFIPSMRFLCPTFKVCECKFKEGQSFYINPCCFYCLFIQPGRNQRIKLVVDHLEHNTSSTTEDSGTETQRNQIPSIPNSHSNVNGNVYLSQNGTIVRTRRLTHPNNLKMGSPCRLGKQFKKLDKLAVTQEENIPINNIEVAENETGNGVSTCVSSASSVDVNLNLNSQICCGSPGSNITNLKTFGSKGSISKAIGPACGADELETFVDNHKVSRETLESHSDHTLSEEDELWMGPWNCLHIPMTKL